MCVCGAGEEGERRGEGEGGGEGCKEGGQHKISRVFPPVPNFDLFCSL